MFPRPLRIAASVAVVAALAWNRDAAAEPLRDSTLTASTLAAVPVPASKFALFGWVSPPLAFTSAERYAEMAAAGFNLTVPAWDDSGRASDNWERLDVTRPLGVSNLILDNGLDTVSVRSPAAIAYAESVASRYRGDPAVFGYYLGDEPAPAVFPQLGTWYRLLRARDPAHPAWNNLLPLGAFADTASFGAYLRSFVSYTHPAILCNSQYDLCTTGDAGKLTQNIAMLSATARANRLPFWGVVQLVEHGWFRRLTEGEIRWQVAQWLAWGTRGIGYFTYWTPAPDDYYDWQPAMIAWGSGMRTPYYDMVAALNVRVASTGAALAGMTWRSTQHAGSVPVGGVPFVPDSALEAIAGRATIGRFTDSSGTTCLLVANADSLAPRVLVLRPGAGHGYARLTDDGLAWGALAPRADGATELSLDPGDFSLLRLTDGGAPETAGAPAAPRPAGPALELRPNPARGAVRLAARGVRGAATLAVLDVSGRVIWSRALRGEGEIAWDGARDSGGRAGAGVYFARLADAGGTVVRRLAWLGPR